MNLTMAQTKDEKAVAAATENLRKALVDGDGATLNKLTDDKLTYGHSGGAKAETKKEFIDNIVNGNSDFVSIDLTDQTVIVEGATAVVRHRLVASTNDKGKEPGTVDLLILLVWHKTKAGDWKLLARQAVKTKH
ncbi:hypothetical protein FLA_5086 [Filimonas lacunae]|nr:hypothetical protein FLA_5086 [Filimonas lacunae]